MLQQCCRHDLAGDAPVRGEPLDIASAVTRPACLLPGSEVGILRAHLEDLTPSHPTRQSGAVRLRVCDTQYGDNSGAFRVYLVIIPASAFPPAAKGEAE
jgi:hypothetical protein